MQAVDDEMKSKKRTQTEAFSEPTGKGLDTSLATKILSFVQALALRSGRSLYLNCFFRPEVLMPILQERKSERK
jgi:hypothetical protein